MPQPCVQAMHVKSSPRVPPFFASGIVGGEDTGSKWLLYHLEEVKLSHIYSCPSVHATALYHCTVLCKHTPALVHATWTLLSRQTPPCMWTYCVFFCPNTLPARPLPTRVGACPTCCPCCAVLCCAVLCCAVQDLQKVQDYLTCKVR